MTEPNEPELDWNLLVPTISIHPEIASIGDIAAEKRHYAKDKATRNKPVGVLLPQVYGFEAMQIDWMTIEEAGQAIPPAYSRYIAEQFLKARLHETH